MTPFSTTYLICCFSLKAGIPVKFSVGTPKFILKKNYHFWFETFQTCKAILRSQVKFVQWTIHTCTCWKQYQLLLSWNWPLGVRDNKLHVCTRIYKATAVIMAKKEKNQTSLGMYCKGSRSSLTVRLEKSPSVIF